MFIQTEPTPNPATLKFLPGEMVLGIERTPRDYRTQEDATEASTGSPLALELFRQPGVVGVLLGADFITVTKAETHHWQTLKPLLLGAIMDHFVSRLPIVNDGETAPIAKPTGSMPQTEIEQQIVQILDERIRPAVAQDGGDITFDRFEDGVLYVQLRGACAGCPSSTATLKQGIENMLRHYIPEVQEVRAANG